MFPMQLSLILVGHFSIFQVDNSTNPPLDINCLYDKYNDSPTATHGQQSKFMLSWDVDISYVLPPGKYVALVHMDEPNTEKEFAIVFKSTNKINIK